MFWVGRIFPCFFFSIFFFERTRPAASMSPPCLIYLSTNTDCESSTRPISKNPGSMEAGEYGLTRRTFFRAPSRVGRGRWAYVGFTVCFRWGDFFRAFHEFAFSYSFVDSVSEQPAWTRRRGFDSQPICPPRTRAHLSPPGVPFSVLPPEKFGVSS